MNGWGAIQYVGSGLSLVAFVVAAMLYAYQARLKQQRNVIAALPEADRLAAIERTAEFFHVDIAGLTKPQKQELVLAQIKLKEKRQILIATIVTIIAILLACVALVAILQPTFRTSDDSTKSVPPELLNSTMERPGHK